MNFYCVTTPDLEATNEVLARACAERGISFASVYPGNLPSKRRNGLRPGEMLYRASTSLAADRTEKLLWRPGVATFYDNPFFECYAQSIWLQRQGVAMPRTSHVIPEERDEVLREVDRLGGFPVVLKIPGGEGGNGILRADSPESLFSLLDWLHGAAVMMEYIDHVVAYRLVVVGSKIVAADASHPGAGDFRSNAWGGSLGPVAPPPKAARLAIKAAQALRLRFGGADVLACADGRMVLAELNFPCYFATLQHESGIDIAGAMLDHLTAQRIQLLGT
ncbi:MAG: hypothetical protein K9J42_11080 [Sulfuritalea sp.]|nr:hypothetical protein [Sulfuritalea sp.]